MLGDVFDFVRVELLVKREDVADLGAAGVGAALALRIGYRPHNLFPRFIRRGGKLDVVVETLAHLMAAVQPDNQGGLGELWLGFREGGTKDVVEPSHYLAGELQVSDLVLPDWDRVGLVHHDVGGHQNGVTDKAVVNVLRLIAGHLLEGRDPGQPAVRGDHAEQRVQGKHLRNMRLDEQDRLVGVEARGQPVEEHLLDVALHLVRCSPGW